MAGPFRESFVRGSENFDFLLKSGEGVRTNILSGLHSVCQQNVSLLGR